jgi:hypothetical protein
VRRVVAYALALALVVSSATVSSLHVHEYVGHDHPDHHHGPATHEHEHSTLAYREHHTSPENAPAMQVESCDPGRHAVSVSLGCAYVRQVHVDLAELPGPTLAVPTAAIRSAVPFTDVRVHGPPFDARIPSRAPPLTQHA